MNVPLAYCSGRFIPQSEAHVALNDAGFVFGATVTDFCRTFHHRVFRLAEHLARFRANCRFVHIALTDSDEDLTRVTEQLVKLNAGLLRSDQELALILVGTPGPIGHFSGHGTGVGPPTFLIHTFPLPFQRYVPWFRDGARLVVSSVRQIPGTSIDPQVKHRSRLVWWLAECEAQAAEGGAHALLANQDGQLTETAAANFLIVRNGTVLTPPRGSVLNGISLRVTEQLCRQGNIRFEETPLTIEDCRNADEAFLTGTAFCLAGVKTVNGVTLPWPGRVTQALTMAWAQLVGLDFRSQILSLQ